MSSLEKRQSTSVGSAPVVPPAIVLTIRVVPDSYLGIPSDVAQALGLRDGLQVAISPWGRTIRLTKRPIPRTRPLTAMASRIKSAYPGEQTDMSLYMTKRGYEELERGADS